MDCDIYEFPVDEDILEKPPKLKIADGPFKLGYSIASGTYGSVYTIKKDKKHVVKVFNEVADGIFELLILRKLAPPFNNDNYFVLCKEAYISTNKIMIKMERGKQDLFTYIKTKKNINQLFIMFYLAKAVEKLHYLNIAHFDLKPQNIIMFGDVPKITDFSISAHNSCHNIYNDEVVTRDYRPPEVFLENREYNGKNVDIWSLGIIFLELLFGFNPIVLEYIVAAVFKILNNNKVSVSTSSENYIMLTLINLIFGKLPKQYNSEYYPFSSSKCNIWNIMRNKLHLNDKLINLLQGMLNVNPNERYDIHQVVNHPFFDSIRNKLNLPIIPEQDCLYELKHLAYYPLIKEDIARREEIYNHSTKYKLEIFERMFLINDIYVLLYNKKISLNVLYAVANVLTFDELTDEEQIEYLETFQNIDFRNFFTLLSDFRDAQIDDDYIKIDYGKLSMICYADGNILNKYKMDILSTAIAWLACALHDKKLKKEYCERISKKLFECVEDVIHLAKHTEYAEKIEIIRLLI